MSKPHVVEQLMEALVPPLETGQILAVQFRALVRGVQMTPEKWDKLMDRFIATHPNRNLMDPDMEKLERSNFERALLSPEMSWKMFCRGLEFIQAKDVCVFVNINTHDSLHVSTAMNFSFSQ